MSFDAFCRRAQGYEDGRHPGPGAETDLPPILIHALGGHSRPGAYLFYTGRFPSLPRRSPFCWTGLSIDPQFLTEMPQRRPAHPRASRPLIPLLHSLSTSPGPVPPPPARVSPSRVNRRSSLPLREYQSRPTEKLQQLHHPKPARGTDGIPRDPSIFLWWDGRYIQHLCQTLLGQGLFHLLS